MPPAGKAAVLLGTFALGFAAAWTTKPSTQPAATTALASPPEHPAGSKSVRPPKDGPDRQIADLLKELEVAGYSPSEKNAVVARITSAEFPDLLQEFVRRAGLTGLDYEGQETLRNLVVAWQAKDHDAALQWALGLPKPKDREEFLSHVIGAMAAKDLNAALALVREHGRNEEGGWSVPFEIGKELAKRDADTLVRTLGSFISTDGSSSGSQVEFAAHFDFRAAMDGLAAIQAGLGSHNNSLASVPTNMLAEWAKRDATAAWAWLQEGKEVPYNDVNGFFKGYALVATPDELTGLLVDAMAGKSTFTERFRLAWDVLAEKPNGATITQFLEKLPGDRNDNLLQLFKTSSNGSGGNYDEFKQLLLHQMSGAERSAVLSDEFKNGATPSQRSFYTPLLRQLGHSDEEIDQLLPEKR